VPGTGVTIHTSGPAHQPVLWLIPTLLAVHNVEEAVAMPRFLRAVALRAPVAVTAMVSPANYHGFLVALMVATILPFAIAAWAWARPESESARWSALCVQAVVAINVVWHIAAAVALGRYTPGLVTAVLLNLPFSIHVFRRASRDGWTSRRGFALLAPAALVLHGPFLLALLFVTGALQR